MPWATLSLKNLINALHEVDDWWGLGIQLDIDYHELQKIAEVHSTVERRKSAMLQLWRDKDVQVSWETLLVSLGKIDLKRIAEKIKSEYQTPSSIQSQGESPLALSATSQSANVTTEDSPSTPPTAQPLTSQSESVTMAPPLTPPTDQPEQPLTSQSESVTMAPPLTPPTDPPEQTSTQRVQKVQQEIATLVDMYDDLVEKTGVSLSRQQAVSPDFLIAFRISIAALPTSLKYQHSYFLEHHSSQIAKATTVEEIFSIVNRYCNFLNCSLLAHIISKFGNEELRKQQSSYIQALQEFRSRTNFSDFFKAHTENRNIPPECVALTTKMGSEWEHRTLQDGEEYRKFMAQYSFLADSALYFQGGRLSSIYLIWYVPNNAVRFLAAAMNSEFLQHHSVEKVTIDGVELEEYKREHYLYGGQFTVISQPLDELSEGLIWASREGCLEDVVFLLSIGVEVNTRGQWEGRTALMQASEGGHMDVVKELLGARAGVDLQDENGYTALMWASFWGKTNAVQELLSSGAQVDLQNKDGYTALMNASLQGHTDIIRELLSGGAQVDLQNKYGMTALIWPSLDGKTEVVRELLSGGAKVDLQTENGQTPLIFAVQDHHTETVKTLLAAGADVNLQEKNSGRSAVFYAAEKGDLEIVMLLIQNGANLHLKDKDGVTADEVAEVNGHNVVCEELRHGDCRPLSKRVPTTVMSQAALSLKNLTNALNKVEDWEGLGIQLDIEYHELQKIFKDHSSTEERKRAMLQFWLKNSMKPSWETLIAALGKLNLKNIADEIKQYQVPSSAQPEDDPPLVSENVTSVDTLHTDPPSSPPTDQPEETSTMGVKKMQQEIATLVTKYDDLVSRTVETFSEMQEDSPHFFRRLQATVAVLPTSLKYQHRYFLEHNCSKIGKATTVEEILSILNNYCDSLNCSLLAHIIGKFGDDKLKKQLSNYMEALREFRSQTKIADFMETYTGSPKLSPEFVPLVTKMSPEWEHRTLEEAVSESVTSADILRTDPPSFPPTDQPEKTSAVRVRKVQQEIATLKDMYDDLVEKTVEKFSERQEDSPHFCRKLRISVAVLPTSLKYQHRFFLEHHSSKIGKATTVEEIFSILNSYWNFLNCNLLAHIINKFGDEELQKQLSSYTTALQSFRLRTRITDFMKAYTGDPTLPQQLVALKMKIGSEWEQCTLEDAEELRRSMATDSSTTDFTTYFMGGVPGSIYKFGDEQLQKN